MKTIRKTILYFKYLFLTNFIENRIIIRGRALRIIIEYDRSRR